MKVSSFRWSSHLVQERLHRLPAGVTLDHFCSSAEELLSCGAYERWYEWDEREGRGVCENLLVEALDGTWVLFRRAGEKAIAVSILTGQQYQFTRANLWSKTIPNGPRPSSERTQMEPLTHNPFAKLRR